MVHFGSGMEVERKADHSPVPAADRHAEAICQSGFGRPAPASPAMARAAVAAGRVPALSGGFFLGDPLDGSNGFSKGRSQFTINIGLIEAGRAVFGLLYAPPLADFYVALGSNEAVNARLEPEARVRSLAEC